MTSEMDDGWIAWTGGECPVPDDFNVDYQMKDESREYASLFSSVRSTLAAALRWTHTGCVSDIIAYRVVTP